MPKYIVVKEHDGIKAGTVKSLPDSPIARYMVKEGYWKEVRNTSTSTNPKEATK